MTSFLGLFSGAEFLTGFIVGLIGLAVTLLFRRRRLDWAVVWVICALCALALTGLLVGPRVRTIEIQPWSLVVGIAVSALAATGLTKARHRASMALGLATSMLAIWATVPDTELISVLVGITAATLWSWWPLPFALPGGAGAGALAAVTAWATLAGGGIRESATVGGLGILAALGFFGVAERWSGGKLARLDLPLLLILVSIWFFAARMSTRPTIVLGSGLIPSGLVIGGVWLASKRASSRTDEIEDPGDDALSSIGPE